MTAIDPTAGLPPDALRRLQESDDSAGGRGLFTSDLSVNEFLLVKEAGFHPRVWCSAARSTTSAFSGAACGRTRSWER